MRVRALQFQTGEPRFADHQDGKPSDRLEKGMLRQGETAVLQFTPRGAVSTSRPTSALHRARPMSDASLRRILLVASVSLDHFYHLIAS
jgi:hypothetical protein